MFWGWPEGGKVGRKPLYAVVKHLATLLPTVAWKAGNVLN